MENEENQTQVSLVSHRPGERVPILKIESKRGGPTADRFPPPQAHSSMRKCCVHVTELKL